MTRIALLTALLAYGCADLTKVDAPDLIQRPALTNPNGAITLFNGAVSSFYNVFGSALSNSGPYVTASGLFSDELTASGLTGTIQDVDRRTLPEASTVNFGPYTQLQAARTNQLQTLSALQQALPSQRWRIGQIFAQTAQLETLIAEMFCSGVPLSALGSDFSPLYGPPLTTAQLLQRAVADFDSALAYATDSARILNMAQVGRGRALLDLNRPADATAAVASVPTTFVFVIEHSAAVTPNTVASLIITNRIVSIPDREGGNGLNYISANDPRISPVLIGTGLDGATPLYRPARLTSTASPNILANGTEARLIEAEAALKAGDVTTWLAKLNLLRATAVSPAMAPLTDPGTPDTRLDLLFRERALWLFLTGHRLGDMRRLVRQYGRAIDAVFPVGTYKYGGPVGTDVTMPMVVAESANNPLMAGKGCIDRNP